MKFSRDNFIQKYGKFRLWAILLILVLAVLGGVLVWFTYTNTESELTNIAYQIDPSVVESGFTPEDYNIPDSAEKVTTGIYIDRIKSISLKDNLWTVDFYIWFKWSGNIDPGQSFQVVDGSMDNKELIKNSTTGTENFSLYKVTSTITKKFDMFRFPVDTQFLTIDVMDTKNGRQALVYIPDNGSSAVGPDVNVQGYYIEGLETVEKPFYYNTTMGDPTMDNTTYSQFRSGVLINREDLTFLFISLIGILIAVFAGLMSLLIMSYQGRFSLEGSAMFVGITNMVLITNLAPTGIATLGHLITAYGLFIIALCLLESSISLSYHKRGEEAFSRKLDIITLKILALGFIITLAAIIFAAWFPYVKF
jgi:hypothetical protein